MTQSVISIGLKYGSLQLSLFKLEDSRADLLSAIRKPERKATLRKISVAPEKTLPNIKLGKIVEKGPPRKPLPHNPNIDDLSRSETWSGKPTKPLPKSPMPQTPSRNSPVPQKKWTGKPSESSAFKENAFVSSSKENKAAPKPPKKPLPSMSSKNGHSSYNLTKTAVSMMMMVKLCVL